MFTLWGFRLFFQIKSNWFWNNSSYITSYHPFVFKCCNTNYFVFMSKWQMPLEMCLRWSILGSPTVLEGKLIISMLRKFLDSLILVLRPPPPRKKPWHDVLVINQNGSLPWKNKLAAGRKKCSFALFSWRCAELILEQQFNYQHGLGSFAPTLGQHAKT